MGGEVEEDEVVEGWVKGGTWTAMRSTNRVKVETLSSRWASPVKRRRRPGRAHLLLKVST